MDDVIVVMFVHDGREKTTQYSQYAAVSRAWGVVVRERGGTPFRQIF